MLNKLKKILQWFVSVCFILSGLIYVGEYTVLAIVLMVLAGVIVLPPVTKKIPAFKFRKAILIITSINCFLRFLIGRFDQRQRISDLCPSNSLCRMKKSLQTAINPVSTCGMIFVQSDRPGFLRQDPADQCVDEVIQIAEESGAEIQFY